MHGNKNADASSGNTKFTSMSNGTSANQLKRDFESGSPQSPVLTSGNIRILLKEELKSISENLKQVKTSLQFTWNKLDEIQFLSDRVTFLEAVNISLTEKVKMYGKNVNIKRRIPANGSPV